MGVAQQPPAIRLLSNVTCPNCWHEFPPAEVLWISGDNVSLQGDAKLGENASQRFLPDRFDVAGNAIDAKGNICTELACPRCHLVVPRACMELPPLFVSVFGLEGSGKSFFLAAMTWELRRCMKSQFKLGFSDADPALNALLNSNIDALFGRTSAAEEKRVMGLIEKTQEFGDQYLDVLIGGETQSYLQPFMFLARPEKGHPLANSDSSGRVVCLYDNAGESFRPGEDRASRPVTRHLGRSEAMIFTFDPTREAAFQERLRSPVAGGFDNFRQQEPLLQEAAKRVRQFAGLRPSEQHKSPLVVAVTKSDAWIDAFDLEFGGASASFTKKVQNAAKGVDVSALDLEAIERGSNQLRKILEETCGEIVSAAETFCSDVTYVPVSAVGNETRIDPETGETFLAAADASPVNASLPFLIAMAKSKSRLIAAGKVKRPSGS